MLAKFTPFGSHDSGKTTTLRVLTYLLYAKADPTYYVHFHRANKPAKGDIYLSSTALTLSSIFNKKGKNKSADWRISFNIKVPTMEEKTFRIAIATPSDTEEEIIKNWDFTSNNNVYKLSRNEPTYIEPDIFVSPCSEGRARDEEML
jgi:predicted ATP-dependent endonuclease of OLD family